MTQLNCQQTFNTNEDVKRRVFFWIEVDCSLVYNNKECNRMYSFVLLLFIVIHCIHANPREINLFNDFIPTFILL